MKKSAILSGSILLLLPSLLGALPTDGLDPEAICGPCGAVATGDVGISGNAKVDGFFNAVASLNDSFVQINGSFEGRIDNLIAAFGTEVAANATLQAKVDALKADIKAEISANAEGGVSVNYVPAKCEANIARVRACLREALAMLPAVLATVCEAR